MAAEKMTDTAENCSAAKKRILSLLATVYIPLYRPIDYSGAFLDYLYKFLFSIIGILRLILHNIIRDAIEYLS